MFFLLIDLGEPQIIHNIVVSLYPYISLLLFEVPRIKFRVLGKCSITEHHLQPPAHVCGQVNVRFLLLFLLILVFRLRLINSTRLTEQ